MEQMVIYGTALNRSVDEIHYIGVDKDTGENVVVLSVDADRSYTLELNGRPLTGRFDEAIRDMPTTDPKAPIVDVFSDRTLHVVYVFGGQKASSGEFKLVVNTETEEGRRLAGALVENGAARITSGDMLEFHDYEEAA